MSLKTLIIFSSILIPCFLGHELEISSLIFGQNRRTRDQSYLEHSKNKTTEIENRIMGGEETTIKDFPWMAGVYILEQNELSFSAAASIITNRHLLTAAHVLIDSKNIPYSIAVLMGSELKYKGDRFEVQKVYVNPGYPKGPGIRNDIGIIQLTDTIPFTDVMRPINLPGINEIFTNFEGQVLTAIGWGYTSNDYDETDVLQKVDIPIIAPEICLEYVDVPTKQFICGGDRKEKTTCEGDSGGPLMTTVDEKYTIVGLTSFIIGNDTTPCGYLTKPAYFTRVPSYLKWINRVINSTH